MGHEMIDQININKQVTSHRVQLAGEPSPMMRDELIHDIEKQGYLVDQRVLLEGPLKEIYIKPAGVLVFVGAACYKCTAVKILNGPIYLSHNESITTKQQVEMLHNMEVFPREAGRSFGVDIGLTHYTIPPLAE